jgi:hypothetical protein
MKPELSKESKRQQRQLETPVDGEDQDEAAWKKRSMSSFAVKATWSSVLCTLSKISLLRSSTHSTSNKGGYVPPFYRVRCLHKRHFAQTIQPALGSADKMLHSPAT